MLISLSALDTETENFRSDPWQYQRTFLTPLGELESFIDEVFSVSKPESAVLSTDLVVFEPLGLLELLQTASIPVTDQWRFTLKAIGEKSSRELLMAALGDWVDFAFIPAPAVIAVYADHDEYTTFYCREESALEALAERLKQAGYKYIPDYIRGPASYKWR